MWTAQKLKVTDFKGWIHEGSVKYSHNAVFLLHAANEWSSHTQIYEKLYKTMRDKDIDKRRNLSHFIFIQYRKWKLTSSDWKPSNVFRVGWCREGDKREVSLRNIRKLWGVNILTMMVNSWPDVFGWQNLSKYTLYVCAVCCVLSVLQ